MTTVSAATSAVAAAAAGLALLGNRRLHQRLASAREQLAAALSAARTDALTGLANRTAIDAALQMRTTAGADYAVLLVDLDDFKPVNDTYGHGAGDVVLAETARRLAAIVDREDDLVGRLGGDEFAIITGCPFGALTAMLARQVVADLATPIEIGAGVRVEVTASVGWVQAGGGDAPRAVLRSADLALYRAKAGGGFRQIEFSPFGPLASVEHRPMRRPRDTHPHRTPSELGVVIAR